MKLSKVHSLDLTLEDSHEGRFSLWGCCSGINSCVLHDLTLEYLHMYLAVQDLYQILSEVKGEVENVISTGRKIVKEGQCADPDDLTQQLDQLKALYNQVDITLLEHFKLHRSGSSSEL